MNHNPFDKLLTKLILNVVFKNASYKLWTIFNVETRVFYSRHTAIINKLLPFIANMLTSSWRVWVVFKLPLTSCRRCPANGVLQFTMDRVLIVLMMAACICGSYKNQMNQPAPFQGHLAMDEAELKYSRKPPIPYYVRSYGNIGIFDR